MIFTFFMPRTLLETSSVLFIIHFEFSSIEFQIAEISQSM